MSARASLVYVGARAVSGASSVVALSLFARWLGPAGYGWFAVITAAAALSAAAVMQPLQQTLGRYLAGTADAGPVVARLMAHSIVGLGASALVVEVAGQAMAWRFAGIALAAWAIGSAQGVFDYAAQFASTSLRPGIYARLYATKAVTTLVLGLSVLAAGMGAAGLTVAISAAYLLSAATGHRDGWRGWRDARMSPEWWHRLRHFALPFGATFLLNNVLQWVDRFVLSASAPAAQVGAYAAVTDLVQQTLGMLFGSLFIAWYPRLLREHEAGAMDHRESLRVKYATFAVALLLPAVSGLILLREPILRLMFGEAFRTLSRDVLPWVATATVLSGVRTWFVDIGLLLSARMSVQLRNVGTAAVVGLALNLWLVPVHGISGAAWSMVAGQMTGLVLSMGSTWDVLRWPLSRESWLPSALSTATMVAVLSPFCIEGAFPLAIAVIGGGSVYGLSMLVLNGAGCRDWLRGRLGPGDRR